MTDEHRTHLQEERRQIRAAESVLSASPPSRATTHSGASENMILNQEDIADVQEENKSSESRPRPLDNLFRQIGDGTWAPPPSARPVSPAPVSPRTITDGGRRVEGPRIVVVRQHRSADQYQWTAADLASLRRDRQEAEAVRDLYYAHNGGVNMSGNEAIPLDPYVPRSNAETRQDNAEFCPEHDADADEELSALEVYQMHQRLAGLDVDGDSEDDDSDSESDIDSLYGNPLDRADDMQAPSGTYDDEDDPMLDSDDEEEELQVEDEAIEAMDNGWVFGDIMERAEEFLLLLDEAASHMTEYDARHLSRQICNSYRHRCD